MRKLWQEYGDVALKILIMLLAIPLLFFIGMLLFSILTFFLSIACFVAVSLMMSGFALMLWAMLDDLLRRPVTSRVSNHDTIIIDGEFTNRD